MGQSCLTVCEFLIRALVLLALVICALLTCPSEVYAGNGAYTYDSLGRVTSAVYPDGSLVSFTYDMAGNRVSVVSARGNSAPIANIDTISTPYMTAITFDPRSNDTDADGDSMTVTAVGAASRGTTAFSATSITYTPTSGNAGSDAFTYTIKDAVGATATGAVSVTIAAPPAPTVTPKTLSVAFNTAGTVSLTPGGVYSSVSLAASPTKGIVNISGTTATYTPTASAYGSDSFTYTATGPGGTSSAATVTVTIGNPPAPTVSAKTLAVSYNTAGTVSLTPSGVYTSVAMVTSPVHGSVSISGTTATFTPTSDYYGSDSFTYTGTGPGGTSSAATVTVTVGNPPAPTVSAKTLAVSYNTAGTVSLTPSGVYTSVAMVTSPVHGSVSISGTTATFTPTSDYYGSDSFTYTGTGPGGTSSAATVTVTVGNPPAPTVSAKTLAVSYNTAGTVSLTPSGVYTSVAMVTSPVHGSVSISGTTATFTPTSDYYGSDSFTYTGTGPGGTSSAATVTVTVGNPPAPTVSAKTLAVSYNTAGTVSLTPSGVYTSVAVVTSPAHGSVSISGTTATYTPTASYTGSDAFTYSATGPGGTSSTATVTVTVQAQPTYSITLTAAGNLRTIANNSGYVGAANVLYQFTVPSGTTILGTSGSGNALDTGTWPSGVTLTLTIAGNVYGGGGKGGNGSASVAGVAGGAGGDAIYVQAPIAITVVSGGSVKGGGGGGGGGSYSLVSAGKKGGGGGGGGFPNGGAGTGATGSGGTGNSGSVGTTSGGGAGGTSSPAGNAGKGGGAATAGSTGYGEDFSSAGGVAGYAVRKNGYAVTISNSGTITGTY
ncbi:hypothetical protein MMA231_04046 (plasmid) [Asticcacaulis sp. MM231]|uniref:Ig-like domain-containing protein n=1 Tax=Asticcacaulis sp. MM231 TaxID=3157666 RepID=UPI0032D57E1F